MIGKTHDLLWGLIRHCEHVCLNCDHRTLRTLRQTERHLQDCSAVLEEFLQPLFFALFLFRGSQCVCLGGGGGRIGCVMQVRAQAMNCITPCPMSGAARCHLYQQTERYLGLLCDSGGFLFRRFSCFVLVSWCSSYVCVAAHLGDSSDFERAGQWEWCLGRGKSGPMQLQGGVLGTRPDLCVFKVLRAHCGVRKCQTETLWTPPLRTPSGPSPDPLRTPSAHAAGVGLQGSTEIR